MSAEYQLPRGMTVADAKKHYEIAIAAGRDPNAQSDDFNIWLAETYPPSAGEASDDADHTLASADDGPDLVSGRRHKLWPTYQKAMAAGKSNEDFWTWLRDYDGASDSCTASSSDDPHGWAEVAATLNAESALSRVRNG